MLRWSCRNDVHLVRIPRENPGDDMAERARLTRQDWIRAARNVLVVSGVEGVKVDQLARGLDVTRGSFYWHFEHRQDLLDALLSSWEWHKLNEIERVRGRDGAGADPAIEVIRICLAEHSDDPMFDLAVRLWARKTPAVATLVRRIDRDWIALVTELLAGALAGDGDVPVRARLIYFHHVGYHALAAEESVEDRLRLAPDYARVLLGRDLQFDSAAFADTARAATLP